MLMPSTFHVFFKFDIFENVTGQTLFVVQDQVDSLLGFWNFKPKLILIRTVESVKKVVSVWETDKLTKSSRSKVNVLRFDGVKQKFAKQFSRSFCGLIKTHFFEKETVQFAAWCSSNLLKKKHFEMSFKTSDCRKISTRETYKSQNSPRPKRAFSQKQTMKERIWNKSFYKYVLFLFARKILTGT